MDARLLAYCFVATVLIVTPGPDTAMVVRSALRSGRRAASLSVLGIGVGSAVWAGASVLGVAILLETSAVAFTAFKLAGAAYLAYLGVRSLIASFRKEIGDGQPGAPPERRPLGGRTALGQGLLNNLLNPKAGAIFVTVFPQFISPGDSPLRLLAMLGFYELVLLAWLNLYGFVLGGPGVRGFGRRMRRSLERVTGVVMIGLGVRLALEKR